MTANPLWVRPVCECSRASAPETVAPIAQRAKVSPWTVRSIQTILLSACASPSKPQPLATQGSRCSATVSTTRCAGTADTLIGSGLQGHIRRASMDISRAKPRGSTWPTDPQRERQQWGDVGARLVGCSVSWSLTPELGLHRPRCPASILQ